MIGNIGNSSGIPIIPRFWPAAGLSEGWLAGCCRAGDVIDHLFFFLFRDRRRQFELWLAGWLLAGWLAMSSMIFFFFLGIDVVSSNCGGCLARLAAGWMAGDVIDGPFFSFFF